MDNCEVIFCWVPVHSNVDDNEIADQLSTHGSTVDIGMLGTSNKTTDQ